MSHEAKIIEVRPQYSQADKTYFMDVTVEVSHEEFEEPKILKFGFPLKTTPEELQKELAKIVATLDSDLVIAKESAELDAGMANVEEVRKSFLPDADLSK